MRRTSSYGSVAEMLAARRRLPAVAVDFHGVLVAHPEGCRGATAPDWPEVPGAVGWLVAASERFNLHVVSARFGGEGGPEAMLAARDWLLAHGVPAAWLGGPRIQLSAAKPPCLVSIDDRCICFRGTFPDPDEIARFRPWNR